MKKSAMTTKKLTRVGTLALAAIMGLSLTACTQDSNNGGETTADTNAADTAANTAADDTAADTADTPAEVEKVNLSVWCPENQIQTGTMDSMCESFQALHPEWDITFTVNAQGEDTAKDQILTDVSAAADVYFFANDQLTELVNAGAISKLGGAAEELVRTTNSEDVIKSVTSGDSIYAIPFTHNTFFMFYDKSILNEDDVTSLEKIMNKDTADGVYNFCFDDAGGWKLGAWYYGAGCWIYGEDGTDPSQGCNFNNAAGLATTNYLIDLIANPKCAYNADVSLSELVETRKIGAWFTGSWDYKMYHDILGDDLGLAIIPTFNPDGNDYQMKSFYGSKCIGVNPQASNPAAAVAFATYLGSEDMQLKRYIETAQIPTNLYLANHEEITADPVATVIMEEAEKAIVVQPSIAEFSNYWNNIGGFVTGIKQGEINKDNAQEKLDQLCDVLKVS